MPRALSLLAVFIFFSVPRLTGEQELPAKGDQCQGKPIGASCWMELSNQPGCYVWNPYFFPGEAMTWTGECDGDFAQGPGTLIRFSDIGHKLWNLSATGAESMREETARKAPS